MTKAKVPKPWSTSSAFGINIRHTIADIHRVYDNVSWMYNCCNRREESKPTHLYASNGSLKYKEAMDLVELWVLLNTLYGKHRYKSRRLAQLQYQYPHGTPNFNETEITTGLWPAYSGRKVAEKQAQAPSMNYRTNLADALQEAGKVTSAMHIRNMQRMQEYFTLPRRIKYIEVESKNLGTTLVTQQ